MAVWIFAYGKNGLANSKPGDAERYLEILNSIPLDELKVLDSIREVSGSFPVRENDFYTNFENLLIRGFNGQSEEEFQAFLERSQLPLLSREETARNMALDWQKREKQEAGAYEQFKTGGIKSQWATLNNDISGILLNNNLVYFRPYEMLKVRLFNDLIWLTGPFEVFSNYSTFLHTISANSRDYYHSYFCQILRAFKSDFIVYGHEWSGIGSDDDEFDYAQLKQQIDRGKSSDSIHTMDGCYYERL